MTELEQAMARLSRSASSHLRLGISPHAPYTVSERLYRAVDDMARGAGLPVAMHLAESRAETQLVQEGSGPFADALRARGIQVARVARSPVQYLAQLGVLDGATACLCIHCVQVDQEDVVLLTRAGVSIAHCPRSNRAHGHGTAPLAAFRRAGLRVGLGTDSVVSVGDSSLWAEAAAAGLDGEDALRMLTLEGARALGLGSEIGSLEVGKAGDLAVFPSTALSRPLPPVAALLTVVAGRVVHG
jgi:5-methylthioadenosine/S-adenosylhomocysteine deaminase